MSRVTSNVVGRRHTRAWLRCVGGIGAALLGALAEAAPANQSSTVISALPYVINAPGSYCLGGDLVLPTVPPIAIAIEIQADGVDLDLGGFSIDGRAAGAGTNATGIRVTNGRRVTVRNGGVLGFARGVDLRGRDNTVESVVFQENTWIALILSGEGHVARRNHISYTGGSTITYDPGTGIVVSGYSGTVVDNEIYETFPTASPTSGPRSIGVSIGGWGSVVQGNRIVPGQGHGGEGSADKWCPVRGTTAVSAVATPSSRTYSPRTRPARRSISWRPNR